MSPTNRTPLGPKSSKNNNFFNTILTTDVDPLNSSPQKVCSIKDVHIIIPDQTQATKPSPTKALYAKTSPNASPTKQPSTKRNNKEIESDGEPLDMTLRGAQPSRKKVKTDQQADELDVSGQTLLGEGNITVPVYDSCDEIRRKINSYLLRQDVTQAAFLREIAKTYPDGRKIQSKVLKDFLNKRGATAGNTSATYYASYVFFEKRRLREGEPKSYHRLQMETSHPGGVDTARRRDRVWAMEGERPVENEYGNVSFAKK